MIDLDSSKASGPDCTSVVLQIKSNFSNVLTDLFNIYPFNLLESHVFGHCIWERWGELAFENNRSWSLLSVVSKNFEKLVNNKLDDHLAKFIFSLISSMASLQIF